MLKHSSSRWKSLSCFRGQKEGVKEGEEDCPVSRLLPETLIVIFGHLAVRDRGRVARVCRAWRDAAYHRSLWLGVEAEFDLGKIQPGLLSDLSRRVRRLKIRAHIFPAEWTRWITDLDLERNMPDLQCLDLEESYAPCNCEFGDKYLPDTRPRTTPMTRLTELTELRMRRHHDVFCHLDVGEIVRNFKSLISLELSRFPVTSDSLKVIVSGLCRLRRLELKGCSGITDVGIAYLTGCDGGDSSGDLPRLEYLGLAGVYLTPLSLKYLCVGQPTLQSLALDRSIFESGGENATGGDEVEHLSRLIDLQELTVSGYFDTFTLTLKPPFGSLRLSVDQVTEIGNAIAAGERPAITRLVVSIADDVTDDHLQHLAKLAHLRELKIPMSPISDTGLSHLVANGQSNIDTLHLANCCHVTDEGMKHLAKLSRLRELVIYNCEVTKLGLIYLSEGGAKVTTLDVSNCSDLRSDGQLIILKGLFPWLRHLTMDNYLHVFGPDMFTLAARHLPELRSFHVNPRLSKAKNKFADVIARRANNRSQHFEPFHPREKVT